MNEKHKYNYGWGTMDIVIRIRFMVFHFSILNNNGSILIFFICYFIILLIDDYIM